MKRVAVVLIGLVMLTGCKPSLDDVKQDVEFVRVCEEGGGRIGYNGFNQMRCIFSEAKS